MKYPKASITIKFYGDTESRISVDTLDLLANMENRHSIFIIHKALHEYAEKVLREGDREVFLGIASEEKKKNIEKLKNLLKPRQYEDDDGPLTDEQLKKISELAYVKDFDPDTVLWDIIGKDAPDFIKRSIKARPNPASSVVFFNDFKYHTVVSTEPKPDLDKKD